MNLQNISAIDWARLAAFIDGEGSIFITRYVQKETPSRSVRHQLVIHLTNTDMRMMVWLGRTFGFGCFMSDVIPSKRKRYRWAVTGKVAADVLTGCLPYFIMKRDQAETALAFQQTKNIWGRSGKVPPEVRLDWTHKYLKLKEQKTPPANVREMMERVQ